MKVSFAGKVSVAKKRRAGRSVFRLRTGKGRRALGTWASFSLAIVAVMVAGLILFAFTTKVIRPYREAAGQARDLAATGHQVAALDNQNRELLRQIAYLKTREGIEYQARSMGYVLPGEVPFFVDPGVATVAAAPAPAPVDLSAGAKLHRFWSRLLPH